VSAVDKGDLDVLYSLSGRVRSFLAPCSCLVEAPMTSTTLAEIGKPLTFGTGRNAREPL
jgi:hypothetical protein